MEFWHHFVSLCDTVEDTVWLTKNGFLSLENFFSNFQNGPTS